MEENIGERIRKRRKSLHITQLQIQNEIGISSGNLSGIESGKSLPSASALIGLSKILNCTTDWILTGISPKLENFIVSDMEKNMIENFRTLPENEQNDILSYIKIRAALKNLSDKDIKKETEQLSHSKDNPNNDTSEMLA